MLICTRYNHTDVTPDYDDDPLRQGYSRPRADHGDMAHPHQYQENIYPSVEAFPDPHPLSTGLRRGPTSLSTFDRQEEVGIERAVFPVAVPVERGGNGLR
jgi:hypothetical protein